jgi:hypothetical protein
MRESPFLRRSARHIRATSKVRSVNNNIRLRRMIMKTILSAIVALSVLAGIAVAPASASDGFKGSYDAGQSSPL